MPWEREDKGGKTFKYQYHPHGDKNQPLREAPSALNTVIIPNVTLPKVILPHLSQLDPVDRPIKIKSLTLLAFSLAGSP